MHRRQCLVVLFAAAILLAAAVGGCNASEPTATVQKWVATEIDFTSDKEYDKPVYDTQMDVIFTHKETGETLTIPAFWDGGTTWKVRFALTETGEWSWKSVCSDKKNKGLHGKRGQVTCTVYTGDLAIYQRGFLKTETGKRYFMYADGTPFFYLGDTHWSLPIEDFDGIGDLDERVAQERGITSQFKYTMDYRAKQGYTVIQSQQLGTWNGTSGNSWMGDRKGTIFLYGVNEMILEKFQALDRYFAYIAEKGFVHAHSQFSYPPDLIVAYPDYLPEERLVALCRYWVARYCAYPVMWATTQEGDNDHYEHSGCTSENNPWKRVMELVAQYDPYDHPSTCHQENTGNTQVENSAFKDLPSHSWFAAQWNQIKYKDDRIIDFDIPKEYWNKTSKPVINYESKYDHFWTGTQGSRVQGWASFMNGMFGYGYGAQPIWNMFWAFNNVAPFSSDGYDTYNTQLTWLEGLELETGQQLPYMKKFLTQYDWWKMEPCFDGNAYYTPNGTNYFVTTIKNDVYLGYFYGKATDRLGTFTGMKNGIYTVRWMNAQTGEFTKTETITVTNGTWQIPAKPDSDDWALAVEKT